MVDKTRALGKIAELESYLAQLKQIAPQTFEEYKKIEKMRSCERLLQLSIECLIDICKLLVSGLKLGLPSEENDLFQKLLNQNILPKDAVSILQEMRAFRNILVHEYATVDDALVFKKVKEGLGDFEIIKRALLAAIQ
ncbi:MAG TPA: hypothetical protein DD723_08945 [Candidatus Omnitrophica bacterium]|nr:MAG: hypothetical protein A2Z81_08545 [Omnitrophica WOR_2 bacterium GWA2_45_18]OGX19352.1 MAG: hypothetical protein A2Y04_01930 [Omnitrophica WOR_2 bacterium GWC2_45_7]HBR15643.1 hypothetical protein [Candidatus Omnitrophota bacterium]